MIPTKRYQVFISSTYIDLVDERQAVLKAVLELEHMPAGMELFPASDDSAWDLIKSVIDESDYYVLIMGGKYGSVHADGVGYTEKEYDYAYSQKKPVVALLHRAVDVIPRGKTEVDDAKWKQLEAFRAKVSSRHTCQFWTNSLELKANAIVSLTSQMKRFPGVGWLRADTVPSGARAEDVLLLKEKIASLEEQLKSAEHGPAKGSEDLEQGEDSHLIEIAVETRSHTWDRYEISFTWDEIFGHIGPALLNEAPELKLRSKFSDFITSNGRRLFMDDTRIPKANRTADPVRTSVTATEIDTCIVQLRALGLITESLKKRSVTDTGKYWALTPYGDHRLTQLRAKRKGVVPPLNEAAAGESV